MKNARKMSVQESYNANKDTEVWVYTDLLNIYNYKNVKAPKQQDLSYMTRWELERFEAETKHAHMLQVLQNVLRFGGTVILCDKATKTKTRVRVNDRTLVVNHILAQLEYCLNKYSRLTNKTLIKMYSWYFGNDKKAAEDFYNNVEWKRWKDANPPYYVLDLLFETLAECEERARVEQEEQDVVGRLDGILDVYQGTEIEELAAMPEDIPNQDVTTLQLPALEMQIGYGDGGLYASFTNSRRYVSNSADELEAKIVNAYYYKHEEFRVPTLDEQLEDLAATRELFADLKAIAQTMTPEELKDSDQFYCDILSVHDHLERLEFEVGLQLDSISLEATVLK